MYEDALEKLNQSLKKLDPNEVEEFDVVIF